MRLYVHLALIVLALALIAVFSPSGDSDEAFFANCLLWGHFFLQVYLAHRWAMNDEEKRKNNTPQRKSLL